MYKLPPEVLIYLQTVKNFLNNNKETKKYLIGNSDENLFFEYITILSKENFEKTGESMLTEEQFELVRKTLIALKLTQTDSQEINFFEIKSLSFIFIDERNISKISTK